MWKDEFVKLHQEGPWFKEPMRVEGLVAHEVVLLHKRKIVVPNAYGQIRMIACTLDIRWH